MNELQTKRRRPSTYTAYRVEEPKPKREYDWDYFPLHFHAGVMVLMGLFIPLALLVLLVAVAGWYAPLIVAGVWAGGWLVWRIGRLVIGDI